MYRLLITYFPLKSAHWKYIKYFRLVLPNLYLHKWFTFSYSVLNCKSGTVFTFSFLKCNFLFIWREDTHTKSDLLLSGSLLKHLQQPGPSQAMLGAGTWAQVHRRWQALRQLCKHLLSLTEDISRELESEAKLRLEPKSSAMRFEHLKQQLRCWAKYCLLRVIFMSIMFSNLLSKSKTRHLLLCPF